MSFLDNLTNSQIIIIILLVHFIADFIFQSDKIAKSKSSSIKALGIHITIYSLILMLVFGPIYALVNGILHFITDYISSKGTKYFHSKGDTHNFFVIIGFDQFDQFDQFVHAVCLIITIPLICWVT